jgi:hypothetical protein
LNTVKINNGNSPDYLVSLRIMVRPDGSIIALVGNQRLTLNAQEVTALIERLLEFSESLTLFEAQ